MSKLTLFAGGAAAGAFFMPILGFAAFGWKLDSKTQIIADDRARAAVVSVLVPACVTRFNADPQVDTHRAAMKDIQLFHPRMLYVEKGGWAEMPGQKRASPGVARACTEELAKAS